MTSRTWFPAWLVIGCAWFFSAPPIEAQTAAGQITGLVKDQAGAPVPGATVTVTETRTNLQRVVVSTSDGVYTVPSLPPGEYRLDLELSGFRRVRREGIRLATGETARIDFDLAVGTVQEQVTVIGDAPVVREATASLGTVVENQQVVQLPLNGRLFIMLAAIAPGSGATLHLVAPDEGATVTIDGQTIEVPARSRTSLPVPGGSAPVLTVSGGVHASVTYRTDAGRASSRILPPVAAPRPITVYP